MTRPDGVMTYRRLLGLPGVARAFTAATLGRLSYATVSLSLLVSVERAAHSYAVAGTSLGAYALAGVAMPLKSRVTDRLGPPRVLPLLSGGLVGVLLLVVVCANAKVTSGPVYVALGAAAGLAAPPLGPTMRALWASLTPDPSARHLAYSLDGVVEEALYAIGPVVVGLVLAVGTGGAALVLTAALNLVGTLGLAGSPAARELARPDAAAPTSGRSRPLRRPGFVLLLLVMLGVGLGGGPLEVATLARAQERGHPHAVGYLLGVLSIGSAAGGLVWGHVRPPGRAPIQLGTLVAVMAAGVATAAFAPTLLGLGIALALTGVVTAPALVVAYVTADDLVPPGVRSEASTWVSTSTNLGVALGAAAAGVVVGGADAGAAFVVGAVVLSLTAVLALVTAGTTDPGR